MARLTPTPDQDAAIEQMRSEPTRACLQISALGSGKTLMAVELALRLKAKQLLVIAPVGTHKGWEATLKRQGWPHPTRPITPKTPENHAALVAGEPGAYLVGREFFYLSANAAPPKETKVDHTYVGGTLSGTTKASEIVLAYSNNSVHVPVENGEFSFGCPRPMRVITVSKGRKARWSWHKAKPDLVVLDESHASANRYGLMFETLKTLPKTPYKLAMSATPQGSHFDGIWAVTRWLWPQYPGPVDRSKQRWVAEWCTVEEVVTGRDAQGELTTVQKVVGEKNPGAFLRSLPCVVKVEAEKKPYEEYNVYVTLSPEHKAVWDEMAETSIAWMNDNPTVAKLPMEKRLRLRQMALAMPDIGEEGEVGFVPDAESPKLNAALKIQSRHPGEAILYVTDSAKFARIAAPRLGARLLIGGMKKADRDWLVDNLGKEYLYLVCTYGAVAEGTDGAQRNCHIEVLFNPADSAVQNEQFSGRLNRIGQTADRVVRYNLKAKETLDDKHYVRSEFMTKLRRKEVGL